jgi:hypothetical protein
MTKIMGFFGTTEVVPSYKAIGEVSFSASCEAVLHPLLK